MAQSSIIIHEDGSVDALRVQPSMSLHYVRLLQGLAMQLLDMHEKWASEAIEGEVEEKEATGFEEI